MGPTLIAIRRLMLAVLGPPAVVMATVAVAALGAGIAQTGGRERVCGRDRIQAGPHQSHCESSRICFRCAQRRDWASR